MARDPLRQFDLGTEEKLNWSKKPRDNARCKAFHATILSNAPLFAWWACIHPSQVSLP